MKISARNRLKGKIIEVTKGATTAHVRIDIGNGVIVNEAVDELGLTVGGNAYAVVKASDVMSQSTDPLERSSKIALENARGDIDCGERLEPGLILGIETMRRGAVEIEHADNSAVLDQRDHQLRSGSGVTGDVSGKFVDIRNQHGTRFRNRCTADSLADGNAHTSDPALERAEDQLVFGSQEIEAHPVQIGNELEDKRREVCGIGNGVAFAFEQPLKLACEFAIEGALVALPYVPRGVHHNYLSGCSGASAAIPFCKHAPFRFQPESLRAAAARSA